MTKAGAIKRIHLQYFAVLREQRGLKSETVKTKSATAKELYKELKKMHGFQLSLEILKVAINNEYKGWDTPLKDNDTLVFIPPVAGG